MKNLICLLLIILLAGCGHREFQIPEEVSAVLEMAGENRAELEKVINHYKKEGDVIREEAAYFLMANMKNQGYITFRLVDSLDQTIKFDVLDYKNYDHLLIAWDSIVKKHGEIRFKKDTMLEDCRVIRYEYLVENIDLAVKAWETFPWAKRLTFDQFCEYILPYRSTNEPLESWRPFFMEKLKWVADSVKDPSDPVEAACYVNDYIKSWFRFDPRFYEHPTDQGLQEMLNGKLGRCEDMTNLAIYAMRSLAIPVMSDFTPYWANTGNNHAWNAILDRNDSVIIFMGGEANPGSYELGHILAKVYRKTFASQKTSLPEKLEPWEKAPPYLDKSNILDVTPEYVNTKSVKIELTKGIPDSTNFAYLCVFNSGQWKAIDYTRFHGITAMYSKVGLGVAYLPAFYYNQEIIPGANAFILTDSGNVIRKVPNGNNRIDLELVSTTTRATRETTDFIEQTSFNKGATYILYYWNDKWVESGRQEAHGGPLEFKQVPSDAIYWLVEDGGRKEERIFTMDELGRQVWW